MAISDIYLKRNRAAVVRAVEVGTEKSGLEQSTSNGRQDANDRNWGARIDPDAAKLTLGGGDTADPAGEIELYEGPGQSSASRRRIQLKADGDRDGFTRFAVDGADATVTVGGDGRGGSLNLTDGNLNVSTAIRGGTNTMGGRIFLANEDGDNRLRMEGGTIGRSPRLQIMASDFGRTVHVDIQGDSDGYDGGLVKVNDEAGNSGVEVRGHRRSVLFKPKQPPQNDGGDRDSDDDDGFQTDDNVIVVSESGTSETNLEALQPNPAPTYELTHNPAPDVFSNHQGMTLGPVEEDVGPQIRVDATDDVVTIEDYDGDPVFEVDIDNQTIKTAWSIQEGSL